MLKVFFPTLLMVPLTWMVPAKWLWHASVAHSLLIALTSLTWLKSTSETSWGFLSSFLAVDPVSIPLLVLTCWLLPLMIIASQNHMAPEPINRQRMYITILTSLQILLILAFSATEMILFFITFEATLLPTLFLITRWGNQPERLTAGNYFMFYTLVGSLPLLIALLIYQNDTGTLSLLTIQLSKPPMLTTYADKFWWTACVLAFLVKLPLYGFHLWLPKAHVEAPIAGSMILAAILLKLGGYGMIRFMPLLVHQTSELGYPFMILALWGVVMTGLICLREADLKSLIAYSSVGHMGLVVVGILCQSTWGLTGAIILMVAHGLTSSSLFCLANTTYERIHSRTMLLARGLQTVLPLMATWWFFSTLANLALPPLPNLMGELMIIAAMFGWSWWSMALMGTGTVITAAYSLHMLLMTQRGQLPAHITALEPSHSREHLLITLHLAPLALLILRPQLIWGPSA
nr:NADH dehydrogenase subunit 4 [Odontoscion dentex]